MSPVDLPYLLEAEALYEVLKHGDAPSLAIVCLGREQQYLESHIPGARWLDVARLNRGTRPAPGLLPDAAALEAAFADIGLDRDDHVVCYDDDGGTNGARMAWVLEAMGHRSISMLNGGLGPWKAAGYPTAAGEEPPGSPTNPWRAHADDSVVADKDYVLAVLGDPDIRILDSRSEDEFMGRKTRSARLGRIPGARNLDWLATIDPNRLNRLLPREELERMLSDRDIDRDHEIVVHCQTHQRSAHTFVMLRSLGFNRVKAYAGSWMEWAADEDLPIICEDQGSNRP